MSLFQFKKKQLTTNKAHHSITVKQIKVLGSGCKNCHTLFKNTKEAIQQLKLSIPVEYMTDMKQVMEYGVMSMPALVVDEKVVSMGKVLKMNEVIALLEKISS